MRCATVSRARNTEGALAVVAPSTAQRRQHRRSLFARGAEDLVSTAADPRLSAALRINGRNYRSRKLLDDFKIRFLREAISNHAAQQSLFPTCTKWNGRAA